MAITLVVNNISFDYPEQGEQQPWGEAATGWAVEVTKALGSVTGPSDILETAASIDNNISTFTTIPGFFFDPTTVRSFSVRGNISRVYDSGASEVTEEFLITGLNQGVSGWIIQQEGIGESGVTFDLDVTGQMKYKSTSLVNYTSGKIKFRGIGILKN